MISTFHCGESGQRLSILDYDESRTNNVKYRAVINDDQTAVLHLQSVDTKDIHHDVSQLSLCPGVLESEVLPLLSQSPVSNSLVCVMFLIEKLQADIVYRSRSCQLLYDPRRWKGRCFSCGDLLNDLRINADGEKSDGDLGLTDLIFQSDNEDEDHFNGSKDSPADLLGNIKSEAPNVPDSLTEDTVVKPVVIKILKEESVGDHDCGDDDTKHEDEEDGDITADQDQHHEGSQRKKNQINTKRKWPCPDCPVTFSSQLCLVKHASKKHGLSLPLPEPRKKEKCPFCEETFDKYKKDSKQTVFGQKIHTHLVYFHPEKKEDPHYQQILGRFETRQFICQHCGRSCPTNRSLEDHMVELHGAHVNTLPCHICGIFLKNQPSLDYHVKRHHNSKTILCVDCGRTFKSKSDMITHVERMHSDTKYICPMPECGSEFRAKISMRAHIRRRHGKPREKGEICSQCQKAFYTLSNLKKHISDVHDKLKAFFCEECQFKCARLDLVGF